MRNHEAGPTGGGGTRRRGTSAWIAAAGHLAILGAGWAAVVFLWTSAPGQSVGGAAAHALGTLALAALLAVQSVATSAALAVELRRRRINWRRLAMIHMVGLPVSIAVVAGIAWLATLIDDRLLPQIPGTAAWNRSHPFQRLEACLPTGDIRIAIGEKNRALLLVEMGPGVDPSPWLRDAVIADRDASAPWRLYKRGRVTRARVQQTAGGWRLTGLLEAAGLSDGQPSKIEIGCNGGVVILDEDPSQPNLSGTGGLARLAAPLPPVRWSRATEEELMLLARWRGPVGAATPVLRNLPHPPAAPATPDPLTVKKSAGNQPPSTSPE
jgi:hypothetical protein